MFKELMPLIRKRPLTITVAAPSEGRIRVNVVPQSLKEDSETNSKIKVTHRDEVGAVPDAAIKALTTPLCLTGTAEEIDAKLPEALAQFVESHVHLQDTLDRATAQIAEAVKAIEEREKNKAKTKTPTAPKEDNKPEQKEKDKRSEPGELLPLWGKPSEKPAALNAKENNTVQSAPTSISPQNAIEARGG